MIFIDASAIVAILANESDADRLVLILAAERDPITSPIAILEAALAIRRKRGLTISMARQAVREFLTLANVRVVPITDADADGAIGAFSAFGKGTGHPAQLNLGDCFAYAVAQSAHARMLCTGNDFALTDIPIAG